MKPVVRRRHWQELDVLRGAAAVLMVFNHVIVQSECAATDWGGRVGFVSSFAPVMFFLVTGLGSGIQSVGRPPRSFPVVRVAVLVAADVFLWVKPNHLIGMDFLAFIGLSVLMLKVVERTRHSGATALIAAASFVLLRFGAGSIARPWVVNHEWARGLGFVLGLDALDGFSSYPPAPWLAYPFLGFSFGQWAAKNEAFVVSRRVGIACSLAIIATLTAGVAFVLVSRGAVLFRWGSMSATYFIASLSAISCCLSLATVAPLVRVTALLGQGVALGGVCSFAVVPIHYALIEFASKWLGPVVDFFSYIRTALSVVVLSFASSYFVPLVASRLPRTHNAIAVFCLVVGVCAAMGYIALACDLVPGPYQLALRSTSQLALCLLLALPLGRRS